MDNWIDELARALGQEPLTSAETTQLLASIHGGVESAFPVKPLEAGL
jgi:hypothetical protein